MNWEMIGAISQLVAAIGLVPSLVYLAIQAREQTKANRRVSLDVLTAEWTETSSTVNKSPDFGLIYLRGLESFETLDRLSKIRFAAYLFTAFRYWEACYFHYRDGTLPPSSWNALRRYITDMVAYPGVQEWWTTRKHWHTEEFCAFITTIVMQAPPPTAYTNYPPDESIRALHSN